MSEIKTKDFRIRIHKPIPYTKQRNVIWIEKKDGEGKSLSLDELWKDF